VDVRATVEHTAVEAADPPRRSRFAVWARRFGLVVGELLTGAGLTAVLAVAWLMWGQSPLPTVAQQHTNAVIQKAIRAGNQLPAGVLALVRIPALGAAWQYPLYQGVTSTQLSRGLGHYPGTALPGGLGNFALAGHRSSDTGFEPLADLPTDIRVGDRVEVETTAGQYVYVVTGTAHTSPEDVRVLLPDQGRGALPANRLITITTCTPRFGSSGRFIVFGRLSLFTPASAVVSTGAAPSASPGRK
jgi:sortase A